MLRIGILCALLCAAWAATHGASQQCHSRRPESVPLSMHKYFYPGAFTERPIALTNVNVIDPSLSSENSFPSSTILIEGGLISAVSLSQPMILPSDVEVLDFSGHTVLPGLVGMHEHMFYPASLQAGLYSDQTYTSPKLYLAGGVTTARTGGTMHPFSDINTLTAIAKGQLPGPRILPTAPYLDGVNNPIPQVSVLHDAEEAESFVAFWFSQGFTNYKAYMWITNSLLKASIDTAHELGAKVTAHLCAVTYSEAVDLAQGIDCLEHGLMEATDFIPNKQKDVCPGGTTQLETIANLDLTSQPVQDLIHKLVANNVTLTSTLAIFETFVPGRATLDPEVLDKMLPQAREEYVARRASLEAQNSTLYKLGLQKEMEFEMMFVASGGLLQAGADPTGFGGVLGGYGDIRNVELLVEAGFTNIEAVKIATTNGAKYLGEEKCIGNVAAGSNADLMVVKGDPAKDITDLRNVVAVFKDGIGYDPEPLRQEALGMVSWV